MTAFYMDGNFAPVRDEATAYDLPVEGAIPAALSEAETLVAQARAALSVLPAGVERDALDALANYVTRRGF